MMIPPYHVCPACKGKKIRERFDGLKGPCPACDGSGVRRRCSKETCPAFGEAGDEPGIQATSVCTHSVLEVIAPTTRVLRLGFVSAPPPSYCPGDYPSCAELVECRVCRMACVPAKVDGMSHGYVCGTCWHYVKPLELDGFVCWVQDWATKEWMRSRMAFGKEPSQLELQSGDKSHLGFGGDRHDVLILATGETRVSHNVWSAGRIPRACWDEPACQVTAHLLVKGQPQHPPDASGAESYVV